MAKLKNPSLFRAARLYGRCVRLHIGAEVIDLKVMGDREDATAVRDRLLEALADAGVTIEEVTK